MTIFPRINKYLVHCPEVIHSEGVRRVGLPGSLYPSNALMGGIPGGKLKGGESNQSKLKVFVIVTRYLDTGFNLVVRRWLL